MPDALVHFDWLVTSWLVTGSAATQRGGQPLLGWCGSLQHNSRTIAGLASSDHLTSLKP